MDFTKAIKIQDLVFGPSETFSDRQTWKKRNLYKIYYIDEIAFLAIEKRFDTFHIWLMASTKPNNGGKLFKQMSEDIKKENIKKITVSTIPSKFTLMYQWLKRIGFVEYERFLIDGVIKVYLTIDCDQFCNYVQKY